MAKSRGDGVAAVMRDVESLAKRLRADLRKRANPAKLEKTLKAAGAQLRKRAAAAAAQIEKYVHEIRKDLEGSAKKAPAKRRPKPRAKAAAPATQA